jgi:amidase
LAPLPRHGALAIWGAAGDRDAVDVGARRVAVHTDTGHAEAEPETSAAVGRAADALRAAGAAVEAAAPPGGGHDLVLDVWRSYAGDMPSAELYRVLRRWDAYRTAMLAFGRRADVILSPVFPEPARAHGTMNVPGAVDPTSFTTPHSLTGWPAATVRCGTSAGGLPIGVQVVAHPWRDDVALAAALRIERELGGWQPADVPGAAAP